MVTTRIATNAEFTQVLSAALKKRANAHEGTLEDWLIETSEAKGYSQTSLASWLRGKSSLKGSSLLNLCIYFGPEFTKEIFGDDDDASDEKVTAAKARLAAARSRFKGELPRLKEMVEEADAAEAELKAARAAARDKKRNV